MIKHLIKSEEKKVMSAAPWFAADPRDTQHPSKPPTHPESADW